MAKTSLSAKRAEEALREAKQAAEASKAEYEQLVSMISDIIWRYDINVQGENIGSYISSVADKLLGLPAGTIGNSFDKYFSYVHPDDLPIVQKILFEGIQTLGKDKTAEYRLRKADGTTLWVRSKGSAYSQSDGRVTVFGTTRDITERKRAEEALCNEKEFADGLINTAQAIILVLDTQGRIAMINPYLEEISGYRLDEVRGKDWFETFLPESNRQRVRTLFSQATSGTRTKGNINAIVTKDGQEILIEWYDKTLLDPSGKVTGLLSIGQDITGRKRTEDALKESEERYRNLVERANDSITIIQDGTIRYANPALVKLWGGSVEEIVGRPFTDFIDPNEIPKVIERYQLRMANKNVTPIYETILMRRDSNKIFAELNAGLITFQEMPADMIIIRDITERKLAEIALQESEERYRRLAENAPDVLSRIDFIPEPHLSYLSPAVKCLGYTPEEFYADPELMFKLVHPDDRPLFESFARGEKLPGIPVTIRRLSKTGTYIWTEQLSVPIYDDAGNMVAVESIGRDITERKKVEEALKNSEQEKAAVLSGLKNGSVEYLDPQMRIVWVNEAVQESLGLSVKDMQGKYCFELIEGLKAPCSGCTAVIACKTGEPQEGELVTPDGKTWISCSNPLKDSLGQVTGVVHVAINITERKRAEEALKESEQLFSSLVQHSAIATFVVDPEHKVLNWNKACEELTDVRAEEVIGTNNHWQAFYAKHRPCLADVIIDNKTEIMDELYEIHAKSKLIPNGLHAEGWYPNLGGKERYILFDAAPIYGINGKLVAAIETLQDITERKRAEEALKESEQLFSSLVQHSAIATFVVDPEHKVLNWNKACEELTGVRAEEVIGTNNHWQAFYAKHRPCLADVIIDNKTEIMDELYEIHAKSKLIPNGLHAEGWYPNLGGKERYILFDAAPIYGINGKLVAAIETLQDITERKLAEEELRKTRNYLENLIDYANTPIIVWDPSFGITRLNHAFERLTGLKADEVLGDPLATLFPESSREESMAYIKRTLSGEHWEVVEIPILSTDGSVRTVLWNSANIQDKDGKIMATIAQGTDITERKRIEKELRRSRNGLEQRVKKRTEELARKNTEMERFIYTVSHDLRTPLISVSGFLGLIKQDTEKGDLEHLNTDLRIANEAVTKMDKLLMETLELSRIGRVVNPPEDVPFGEIVEDALGQTSEKIKSKGVKVSVAQNLSVVHVDRMRIAEILVNLIENSIKYMGDQAHPKIEIGHRHDEEETFFVRDNGVGIDLSQHEKVFGLFYRLDPKSKGTGVGLTIVKRIIEVHGGRIWIESELGKGCTVCFTLPLANVE